MEMKLFCHDKIVSFSMHIIYFFMSYNFHITNGEMHHTFVTVRLYYVFVILKTGLTRA